MKTMSTIGLDIAKRVFQVHGVDEKGQVVVQKQLRRAKVLHWFGELEPCLVGIEFCATATYWAREIGKLGHDVKLMPPAYVKPYVRRQKNDRNDAAAICEAVSRPSMRFVAVKTIDQQAIQVLHHTRAVLVIQHTQAINSLRAHLAEFGLVFPQGKAAVMLMIGAFKDHRVEELPAFVQTVLSSLAGQIEQLKHEIGKLDKVMTAWHRAHEDSTRLATIPGGGVVTATSLVAAIGDGKQFKSGRELAAWIGLVPNQNSSGGKDRLGRISKRGNKQLRSLLVCGATAVVRSRYGRNGIRDDWFASLLKRKTARVATVALAHKMARVAWAVLTKGGVYRSAPVVANDASAAAPSAMMVAA